MTHPFFWCGHEAHEIRRKHLEAEQRAIDEARAVAVNCPVLEDEPE